MPLIADVPPILTTAHLSSPHLQPTAEYPVRDKDKDMKVGVPEEIVRRWVEHCTKADPDYGRGVADAMGLKLPLAAE